MITYERLHEVLDYDSESGIFTWKVSRRGCRIGSVAGCIDKHGYYVIKIDKKKYQGHRLAWMYVNGYMPENDIDHINRNKTDNRIDNLREVSRQCNLRNTGNRNDNTSRVKGVYFNKTTNKWYAQITVNQKQIHLGYFEDFNDAVLARYKKECELGWKGCDSNSPSYKYLKKHELI